MVWYPTVEDIVDSNKIALRLTLDKHPHKLRGSLDGLQHKIDEIKNSEAIGLTYQAARLLKEITVMHAFDGANHRTAYLVSLFFLTQNGIRLKAEQAQAVDEFMTSIGSKEIGEVQAWIEQFIVQPE